MRNFLIRVVINAVAIAITASILPGVHVLNNDIGTLLIIGLVFGLVNGLIKPIISALTCPLVLLTLGLFVFVINGLMLLLTAALSDGRLVVDGLGWAILGGIIMGIVGVAMEWLLGANNSN
ncbi:MAG TPA: phage holin family protein [Phototrophicaceae bacterium]|jgi:putative membrane protein|nr:phage holin family protein [Phototrophicaceae bacterium]